MASVFGHGMVGITIAQFARAKQTKWLLFFAILSTILPDADVKQGHRACVKRLAERSDSAPGSHHHPA